MKLHQLQALVAAVDQGSIRAAARDMHLTQAALSKSLRQLEEEAGVALLVRQSRGISLTDAGQRLLTRAKLVVRQLALAEDDLRQHLGQDTGTVCVGLTPYLMFTVLGEAFVWFRKRYPRVELRLVEGLVTRVLPGLRDGSLDFAIVADSGDLLAKEFAAIRLRQERQALVVRAGHPALAAPTPARLAALQWVLPGPFVQGLDAQLQAMFDRAGVPAPPSITRCEAIAAMSLVRQSDAVSVMPQPMLGQVESRDLVAVPSSLQPPDIELVLLSQPDVPLTPAAAYLARCLTDAIRARADGVKR